MTSSSYPSYKDRDRVILLEKQVEDLKQLTTQQNLTIRRLQEESISKSDKISSLLKHGPGDKGYHGHMTMTAQLRNIGSSQFMAKPVAIRPIGEGV